MFCQCEYVSHFTGTKHPYGKVEADVEVKTDYGTFHVCKECAETCLKLWNIHKKEG